MNYVVSIPTLYFIAYILHGVALGGLMVVFADLTILVFGKYVA